MSKKGKKKNFQGMEHLYQEVTSEELISNSANNINLSSSNNGEVSYLKKELIIIMIIMIVLFGVLALILFLDKSNDFLRILAEKLTNLY